jgi:hypothetical protein
MNPLFTQRDLKQMHEDFLANYMGQSKDPLGAFIEQHSRKLGLKQPGIETNVHVVINNQGHSSSIVSDLVEHSGFFSQ